MTQTVSWNQSVAKARTGTKQAMQGRFQAAMASFEQFDRNSKGVTREAQQQGRGLRSFAEEAGLTYGALTHYRSVALWWYDGDLSSADEVAIPEQFNFNALRWVKSLYPGGSELRADLRGKSPLPGRAMWGFADLEAALGVSQHPEAAEEPPVEPQEVFHGSLNNLRFAGERITRTLAAVYELDLDAEQRAAALEAAHKAKAPFDYLIAYLENGSRDGALEALLGREVVPAE